MCNRSKYICCLSILFLTGWGLNAKAQAGVTIVGGTLNNSNQQLGNSNDQLNVHDFINNDANPYADNNTNPPPSQNQVAGLNKEDNIEPTLENGFHMRFEMTSPSISERSGSGYMSAGGGSGAKAKKHVTTLTERSFNAKKKIRGILPKRKKKYRPHLCGRF
jgi:hypothetical protein